jgi:hypothetical protein
MNNSYLRSILISPGAAVQFAFPSDPIVESSQLLRRDVTRRRALTGG